MSLRKTQITALLDIPFISLILKYDYYFNASLVEIVDLDMDLISCQGDFILTSNDRELVIWNTKTNQRRVISLPYRHRYPYPHYNILNNILLYADNKFAIEGTIDDLQGPFPSSDITLLDFITGEQHTHQFKDKFKIYDIKFLKPNNLVFDTWLKGIRILNIETFQEDHITLLNTRSSFSVLTADNQIISGYYGINFWDTNKNKLIGTSDFGAIGGRGTMNMEFLNDELLIARTSMEIGLINFRTRSIINTFNLYEFETEPDEKFPGERAISKKIILHEGNIIVRNSKRIFVFDYDLKLKIQSQLHLHMKFMGLLPDGHLMTISDESLRIWNIEDMRIVFETMEIKGEENVLLNGRLYNLKNGYLSIYE